MSIKVKYEPVLKLMNEFNAKEVSAEEEGGALNIKGSVNSQHEKDLIWDKIKEIGGEGSHDIKADIEVLDKSAYHYHTVGKGESLSAISKKYFGDAAKYNEIFKANTDQLSDPDKIQVGQRLKIPNK